MKREKAGKEGIALIKKQVATFMHERKQKKKIRLLYLLALIVKSGYSYKYDNYERFAWSEIGPFELL